MKHKIIIDFNILLLIRYFEKLILLYLEILIKILIHIINIILYVCFSGRFTTQTPRQTRIMASRQRGMCSTLTSSSSNAESNTPNTGFRKEKIMMREIGCLCSSNDQSVYATADRKPIYIIKNQAPAETAFSFPPPSNAAIVISAPPQINCQPLSTTGSSRSEKRLINTDEQP